MNGKRILLFGTFDFLHAGHLHVLQEAKKLGDELIVCVAQDNIVNHLKGSAPIHSQNERQRLVQSLAFVDEVVLGDSELSSYAVLDTVRPDIIALGYDQQALGEDIAQHRPEFTQVMLSAFQPEKNKSSVIKKSLPL